MFEKMSDEQKKPDISMKEIIKDTLINSTSHGTAFLLYK